MLRCFQVVLLTLGLCGSACALPALEQLAAGDASADVLRLAIDRFDVFEREPELKALPALVDAALEVRLAHLLRHGPAGETAANAGILLKRPAVARELAVLITPQDDLAGLFTRLAEAEALLGERMDTYAALVAAWCVVHDTPVVERINENTVTTADAQGVLMDLVNNEGKLLFPVRKMPAELLVFVVDATAGRDELAWARKTFAGKRDMSERYFEIKYDYEHYSTGRPKRVSTEGFTLQNIQRFGGVCADQAYYAAQVGKSLGIPTAYTRGRSSESGHAWLGYLDPNKPKPAWDFDTGRYGPYQSIRGTISDPQTGQTLPDSTLAMRADGLTVKSTARMEAFALVSLSRRLHQRGADVETILTTLESALRRFPGYTNGWTLLEQLTEDGKLSLAHKQTWAGYIMKLCGDRYPDFAVAALLPLIQNVDDLDARHALWDRVFDRFKSRTDLAAMVRFNQGMSWELANDAERAGRCYEDIINRFAAVTPYVIPALQRTEITLRKAGKGDRVLELYRSTFEKLPAPPPAAPEFLRASNYLRVGSLYEQALRDAGMGAQADDLKAQIQLALQDSKRRR